LGAGVALGAALAAGVVDATVAVGIGVYRIDGDGEGNAAVEHPTSAMVRTRQATRIST
jgi:hypothetical protein